MTDIPLNFDDTILSGPRLSILGALIGGDAVDFTFLQKNLGISDGNLSTHLRKLETENYIRTKKTFVGRKPRTYFSITPQGRNALEDLLQRLEELLAPAQPSNGRRATRAAGRTP